MHLENILVIKENIYFKFINLMCMIIFSITVYISTFFYTFMKHFRLKIELEYFHIYDINVSL